MVATISLLTSTTILLGFTVKLLTSMAIVAVLGEGVEVSFITIAVEPLDLPVIVRVLPDLLAVAIEAIGDP